MQELKHLADDVRAELSFIMSKTGKNFRASQAVVELTVAIHYVFHSPVDKILWDVEEQVSYNLNLQIIDPIEFLTFSWFWVLQRVGRIVCSYLFYTRTKKERDFI